MPFSRILVVFPLDVSGSGELPPAALKRALSVCVTAGNVHVVACVEGLPEPGAPAVERLRDEWEDDTARRLAAMIAACDRQGVDVTQEVAPVADVAAWVAGTAAEGEFDLVVVPAPVYGGGIDGRHGMPLVAALLRRLAMPLLVVRSS